MRRGCTSMRVRRRQSDAKWRASVAMCYDTLKHVIPDCDKISKRKISKALILQETEKHITNLENALSDILSDKARSRGKVVLYQTAQGLMEANLADVRRDLAIKQQNMYLQNYGQRKRSSIPSDIEAGIVNLRSATCPLIVLPSECLNQQAVPSGADLHVLMNQNNAGLCDQVLLQKGPQGPSVMDMNNFSMVSRTPNKPRPKRARHSARVEEFEYFSPDEETPVKNQCRTPRQKQKTERTPTSQPKFEHQSGFTPIKLPLEFETSAPRISTGFTPIKLPTEYGPSEHQLDISSCLTPCKNSTESVLPESPFTAICMKTLSPNSRDELDQEYTFSDQIGLTSLLCDETIDQMDLCEEEEKDLSKMNLRTPQNSVKPKHHRQQAGEKGRRKRLLSLSSTGNSSVQHSVNKVHKKEAKCRRQLEKCFTDDKENIPVNSNIKGNPDSSCLDFDGYYLFYQFVAGDKIKASDVQQSVTSQVSQMWHEMSDDDKDTFIAMAALEGSQSDSSLSDDLRELEVEPINKNSVSTLKQHNNNLPMMSVRRSAPQPTRRPTKSFSFLLPEDHSHVDVQEVPLSQVVLDYKEEHVLVPEVSELVTVLDTTEEAVVPEMPSIKHEIMEPQTLQLHHPLLTEQEIYSQDFHRVPEQSCIIHPHERAVAEDLGFISLSNENSMDADFSQQFHSQATDNSLSEWSGDPVL